MNKNAIVYHYRNDKRFSSFVVYDNKKRKNTTLTHRKNSRTLRSSQIMLKFAAICNVQFAKWLIQ